MHVCVYAPDDPRLAEFLCLVYLVLFDTLSGDQAVAAMSPSLLEVDEVLLDFLNHLHEHRAHFRKQTFTKIIDFADHGFGPVVLPAAPSFSSSSERTLGDLIKVTAREAACSQSSTPVRSETGRESFVSSASEAVEASRHVAVSVRNPATSQKSRRSELRYSTSRRAPSEVSHALRVQVAPRVDVSQTRPQTTTDDRPVYPGLPTTYAPVSYVAALPDPVVVHEPSSQWTATRSCDDSAKESAISQGAWVNYCKVASYHEQYQRLEENHLQSLLPKSHGKSSSRHTRSRRPSQSTASRRTTLTGRSRRRSVDTEDTFMQFHGRPRPQARMHSEWARVSSVADNASFTDNWDSVSVRGAVRHQGPKKQPGCQGIGKKIQQGCLGLW
ncbi:MAG: hypothetical protein KVP17_001372 [Porospora cf. gigantea B]|nr:MAG: hypothetical protein KVP17_001372 [Porospora cf. gigantea B]